MGTTPEETEKAWQIDQQIALRIRDHLARSMNQTQLAKTTGIPEATMSRYLSPSKKTGKYRGTPAWAVLAIANVLGIDPCELYGVPERHPRRAESIADAVARELGDRAGPADLVLIQAMSEWIKAERARLLAEETQLLPNRPLTE